MKINAFRAIGEITAVLAASIAGLIIAAILFQSPYASPFGTLLGVAAAIFFVKLRGETLNTFGFKGAGLGAIVLVTVAIFACAVFLFLFLEPVLERAFGPIDFSIFRPLEGNLGLFVLMVAVSWIGAAFGEEIVYRGFVMTRLAQIFSSSSFGWIVAAIIQAAIFAVLHSYQGWVGVIQIFILAIVFAFAYLLTGRSLVPVIVAHGVVDTYAMTDFYLGGELSRQLSLAG